MKPIYYCNALCGSGKTYAMIDDLVRDFDLQKVLFVAATKDLCDQIAEDFKKKGKTVLVVHSGNSDGNYVKKIIEEKIKTINDFGFGVLIITSASFIDLPEYMRPRLKRWVHVFDEPQKLVETHEINLPYNYEFFTKFIRTMPCLFSDELLKVTAKSEYEIKEFLKRDQDNFCDYIKPVLKKILNKNYEVFIDKRNFEKITIEKEITKDPFLYLPEYKEAIKNGNSENKFNLISILKPTIEKHFSKSIYLGANLHKTMLFDFWQKKYNVKFEIDKKLQAKLRYSKHENGNRLTIYYGQENKFSRHQANLVDKETGLNGFQIHLNLAKELFKPDEKILSLCNKADEKYIPEIWIKLSSVPHGLNSYQDVNQFYGVGAFNFNPRINTLLLSLGISEKSIFYDMNVAPMYQALCRSSLRKIDCFENVIAYVASKAIADLIGEDFLGCTLVAMNGTKEKVVGHIALGNAATKAARIKKVLFEQYQEKLEKFSGEFTMKGGSLPDFSPEHFANLNTIATLNIFKSVLDKSPTIVHKTDVRECVKFLSSYMDRNIIDEKETNELINLVAFSENSRKAEFAEGTHFIVLDFDKGHLTAEKAYEIFNGKEKLSFFAHSTSSNQMVEGQDRFRMFFPASHFMTPEIYYVGFEHLEKILEKNNYYSCPQGKDSEKFLNKIKKKNPLAMLSGIDMSKKSLSSLFFAPAILKGHEEKSFTMKSFLFSHQIEKHSLPVLDIVQACIKELEVLAEEEAKQIQLVTEQLEPDQTLVDKLSDRSDFVKEIIGKPRATNKFNEDLHKQKIINRIEEEMKPGRRSYLACQIGGLIRYWQSTINKIEILKLMVRKGCDKSAIKSAANYAGFRNFDLQMVF